MVVEGGVDGDMTTRLKTSPSRRGRGKLRTILSRRELEREHRRGELDLFRLDDRCDAKAQKMSV